MSRRVLILAACLLALCAVIVEWPARWGGQFSYVVTNGISMEPRFHTGDLGLMRKADHYEIGDIASYHSKQLHVVVMHRIVAKDGDRFIFQGDHNSWRDVDRPGQADMVGRLWVRIPRGGKVLSLVLSPAVLGLIGGLVVVKEGSKRRLRPRRRRGQPTGVPGMIAAAISQRIPLWLACPSRETITAVTATGVVALALAGFAWTIPDRMPSVRNLGYHQQATLSYDAEPGPSAVYPSGQLRMPDPVYLRLVPAIEVHIGYRTDLNGATGVRETRTVFGQVAGGSGWKHNFPLRSEKDIAGGSFETTTTIQIADYQKLIDAAERAVGGSLGPYTIAVITEITLNGQLSGVPVKDTFAPALTFTLDGNQLRLQDTTTGSAASITKVQSGSVGIAGSRPRTLTVPGPNVSVTSVRIGASALAALAFLAAWLLALLRRVNPDGDTIAGRRVQEDGEEVPRRFRTRIVMASSTLIPDNRTVMTVDSMQALHRIAERYERLIMHSVTEVTGRRGDPVEEHTFMVDDDTALYLYLPPTAEAHHHTTEADHHTAEAHHHTAEAHHHTTEAHHTGPDQAIPAPRAATDPESAASWPTGADLPPMPTPVPVFPVRTAGPE